MTEQRDSEPEPGCSFCRKSQDQVAALIANPANDFPRAYICDECISVCAELLEAITKRVGDEQTITTVLTHCSKPTDSLSTDQQATRNKPE